MKLVVVDLEATCNNLPMAVPSEIIQIGISEVDTQKGTVTPAYSVFVRPLKTFILSDFCTELTGITTEQVREAMLFPEAIAHLEERFSLSKKPWASWGDYDRRMIQQASEEYQMPYPMHNQHLNAKLMFLFLGGQKAGMDKAMSLLGLELEGRHHDGGDDAYNIGKVMLKMLSNYSHKPLK